MSNDKDNHWKSQGKMGKGPGDRAGESGPVLDSQVGIKVITEQEFFQMMGIFLPTERTGCMIQNGNPVKTVVGIYMYDVFGRLLPVNAFLSGVSQLTGVPRPIPMDRMTICQSPFGLHLPWACILGYDAQMTEKGNVLCAVCLDKQRWNRIIRLCGGWIIDRPTIY